MGLSFKMSFSEDFSNFYNKFTSTEKGKQLLKIEGIDRDSLDVPHMSRKYFTTDNIADISIDANANANSSNSFNYNNYTSEIVKSQHKLEGYYLLYREIQKEYGTERADDLLNKVFSGDLYFHDSSSIQVPYCFSASTSRLMFEGRTWGQLRSKPPKRLDSFVAQVIETAMDMSQHQAGALALADFLVNISWYTGKDKSITDVMIKQELQKFVHVINNGFRVSSQSPFTNISVFCKNNIRILFEGHVFPDFTKPNIDEVMRVQKIFVEFMAKGDPYSKQPYRFPVVTATTIIDDSFPIDEEFIDFISENNIELGFMNIYSARGIGKIASCCRLINDLQLLGGDSFGNGGVSVGSGRVVTLNLPRIALYVKKNKLEDHEVFDILEDFLEDTHDLLLAHRRILHKRADAGFLPFVKPLNYINIDKHLFSTVGINGVYEMMHFLFDGDVFDENGNIKREVVDKQKDVLSFIHDTTKEWQLVENLPYNVEQVPAESLAPKNAMKDFIVFGNMQPFEMYSNQFVPLEINYDLFDKIKLEGEFYKELSGGGITHLNVGSKIKSKEDMKKLIMFAIENGNDHFAINYSFNTCEENHVSVGTNINEICPICSSKIISRLTRVIGYFTEVNAWNRVRKDQYKNRTFVSI